MFEPGLLARKVVLFSGHMIDAPWADGAAASAGREARSGGRDGKYDRPWSRGILQSAAAHAAVTCSLRRQPLRAAPGLNFASRLMSRHSSRSQWILLTPIGMTAVATKSRATLHLMPDERGPLPAGADPYELNNLWMLESAERFGVGKVVFVCLWNGWGGDGPAGTQ
jgi:hypothetical protein